MMGIEKNAEYYLKRINNLPSLVKDSIRVLKWEAAYSRIFALSMQDLCSKLDMEYTKEDFEGNCKKNYAAMTSFLECFGLKLVPCFIPTNLKFEDRIFVTASPNLQNDEDCCAVNNIIRENRAPQPRDQVHIARMNEKLSNYNILLRVFEALFVVTRERLGTHQRACLNNILSDLVLPFEGLAYLRVCYTFAGEQCNYACDYSDRRYCFRELDSELRLRINNYLALLAANSSTPCTFDPSYPWLDELNACYARVLKESPVQEFAYPDKSFSLGDEVNAARQLHPQSSTFSGELENVSRILSSRLRHAANEETLDQDVMVAEFLNKFCQNLELEPELCRIPVRAIARNRPCFLLSIPDFSRIRFQVLSGEEFRPAAFVYSSSDATLRALFPCIIPEGEDPLAVLKSPGCRRQFEYLRGKGRDDALQLFYNLFFALIIENACCGCNLARSEQLLKMLRLEYRACGSRELLFIVALHFALFGIGDAGSGEQPENLVLQSLLDYPGILDFVLCRLYLRYREQAAAQPLFEAMVKLKCFAELCRRNPGFEDFIRADLLSSRVFEYASALCGPYQDRSILSFRPKNVPLSGGNRLSLRGCGRFGTNIRMVLEQIFVKYLIFPLLNSSNQENFTGFKPVLDEQELVRLEKIFVSARGRLKYLSELAPDESSLAGDLLSGRDCGEVPGQIHAALAGRTFTDLTEVYAQLGLKDSPLSGSCVQELLSRCSLMIIPGISALPVPMRVHCSKFRIIEIDRRQLQDPLLREKLRAAQLALLVFRSAARTMNCAQRLADILDLRGEQYQFALNFLNILEELSADCTNFGNEVYEQIGHESSSRGRSSDHRYFLFYMRILLRSAIKSGMPFKVQQRMDYICRIFHMPGEHWFGLYPEYRTACRLAEKTPEHLDSALIRSRLEESRNIQSVIAKIREEQEWLSPAATPAAPAAAAATATVSVVTPAFQASGAASAVVPLSAATAAAVAANSAAGMPSGTLPESAAAAGTSVPEIQVAALPPGATSLLEALSTEQRESMDLSEFEGLCVSLKFMSGAEAVEELNELCLERFDEPLCEVSLEEHCIYLNHELTVRLLKNR